MDGERTGKKLLECKPGEGTRTGISRLKWKDGTELDLGNAGVTRWRRRALDRRERASAVRQAKAKLQGPWCYTRLFWVAKPCNLVSVSMLQMILLLRLLIYLIMIAALRSIGMWSTLTKAGCRLSTATFLYEAQEKHVANDYRERISSHIRQVRVLQSNALYCPLRNSDLHQSSELSVIRLSLNRPALPNLKSNYWRAIPVFV